MQGLQNRSVVLHWKVSLFSGSSGNDFPETVSNRHFPYLLNNFLCHVSYQSKAQMKKHLLQLNTTTNEYSHILFSYFNAYFRDWNKNQTSLGINKHLLQQSKQNQNRQQKKRCTPIHTLTATCKKHLEQSLNNPVAIINLCSSLSYKIFPVFSSVFFFAFNSDKTKRWLFRLCNQVIGLQNIWKMLL